MGGIAEDERTAHAAAFGVLVFLTVTAVMVLPVLSLAHVAAIVHSLVGRCRIDTKDALGETSTREE